MLQQWALLQEDEAMNNQTAGASSRSQCLWPRKQDENLKVQCDVGPIQKADIDHWKTKMFPGLYPQVSLLQRLVYLHIQYFSFWVEFELYKEIRNFVLRKYKIVSGT